MGLDHMLAMVAIGLCAAHEPLRARVGISLAAALALSGGVLVGHTLAAGVLFEFLALASVGALAVLLLCVRKLPALYGMAAIVLFALVHGAVHAIEQPIEFATTAYTAGVLLSSTALQFFGSALGVLSRGRVHWYGVPLAAAGSWILLGATV
jgi:urease accessory protein